MRTRTWLCALCALLVSACFGGTKTNTGADSSSSGTAAAEALTKGVSFTDGDVVLGALPEATLTNLTLVPGTSDSVLPGDTALMSLDVDNPDGSDQISFTLIQFEGAADHFEVKNTGSPADAGVRADAGFAADVGPKQRNPVKLKLSYKVDPDVCTKLCDTKFKLNVTQAVKLSKGGISGHAKATVELDCTSKGDHRLCPNATKTTSGKTPGADLITAFAALSNSLCSCNPQAGGACSFSSATAACATKSFDNHAAEVASQLPCMQKYVSAQQACVNNAKCVQNELQKCDFAVWAASSQQSGSGDPFAKACGAVPTAINSEINACGGGTDAGASSVEVFQCVTGEQLLKAQLCNGVNDCKDGGDEGSICSMCADGVGKYYSPARCDGHNDCADASDETGCPSKA